MSAPTSPHPHVLICPKLIPYLSIDAHSIYLAMRQMGISSPLITATTFYIDNKNYLFTSGVTYPNFLGRLRHLFNPSLRQATGPIVRLSSLMRGQALSEAAMNRTLVHELEHVAQMDRKDPNRLIGRLGIVSLGFSGAILGNCLAAGNGWRQVCSLIIFTLIGLRLGYHIAPHEIQARERARLTHISAVKRLQ